MSEIPRCIHVTWKSKVLPPRMHANYERWQRLMPDWEVKLYDDADLESLVQRVAPQHLEAFRSFDEQIERVDFARAAMLMDRGGVYVDLDVRPLKSFDDWRSVKEDIVLSSEPPEHFQGQELLSNAVMLSKKNPDAQAFWTGYMDYMAKHYMSGRGPLSNTGPAALAQYVLQGQLPCRLRILSPCEFNGLLDVQLKPELPLFSDGCDFNKAYAIHEWHHTWIEPRPSIEPQLARRAWPWLSLIAIPLGIAVILLLYRRGHRA